MNRKKLRRLLDNTSSYSGYSTALKEYQAEVDAAGEEYDELMGMTEYDYERRFVTWRYWSEVERAEIKLKAALGHYRSAHESAEATTPQQRAKIRAIRREQMQDPLPDARYFQAWSR